MQYLLAIFIGERFVLDDYRWILGPEIKDECGVKPVTFQPSSVLTFSFSPNYLTFIFDPNCVSYSLFHSHRVLCF